MEKASLQPQSLSLGRYKDTTVFANCEAEQIQDMAIRDDDTWVLSHPRSGTTLTQEIVYLLKTGLDFQGAKSQQMDDRFPFLDICDPNLKYFHGLKRVDTMASPRLIKSHLHYHVLPPQLFKSKCKKVYVMRNPKDVIVSCMMLSKYFRRYSHDLTSDQFVKMSLNEEVYSSPWWRHVRDFWLHRDDPALLILRYEDMVKDMRDAVDQIARHLEVDVSQDQTEQIVAHCQFDKMKGRDSTNAVWQAETAQCDPSFGGHIRKGKVGDWMDHLSDQASQLIDHMVADKLAGIGLNFDYGN